MAERPAPYSHFRLDFEQQRKRAKDLLKAARAGDADALARFESLPPKLAEAQYLVARELRFDDWAHLKRHIAAMARERVALETIASSAGAASARAPAERATALDGHLRTLHVRCGSDIRRALLEAGFHGDFYEHSYPYLAGPVREGPGALEQRARFLVEAYGQSREPPLERDQVLDGLRRDEQRLHDSADYDRVVIWSELDCYDQLVLVRLLGHYARHRRPPRLELINVGTFPGTTRFVGLGQLPPEALRMLWATRTPASPAQLKLGIDAWRALASADPRPLAALMRTGTPALPLLAPALHRHLRELPSVENGLSFTEAMVLGLLAEREQSLERIFVLLNAVVDPLPGQGDLEVLRRVLTMEHASGHVFTRRPGVDRAGRARPPWTDVLAITELGRAVLEGHVDFGSLKPPARWVGGVEVGPGKPDWRWDERRKDVRLRSRGSVS
ncbi:MAG TPA: hypothetical protein VF339_11270 [Gammaproteobacteria bacterium]